jgi:uncharacterized protein (TIGR00369 family)
MTALTKEQLADWLDRSAFISFLGLEVISADPGKQEVAMRLAMRPEFERGRGTGQWHGGPIAAAIDTVGDYALIMMIGRALPTVNFRVDYLKPAINTNLVATAHVRRNGKSVGVVDVDIVDGSGSVIALGRATYSTAPR